MTQPASGTKHAVVDAISRFDERADAAWGQVFRGHPLADRAFYLASELGDFSLIWLIAAAAQGLRSEEDADASIRIALVLLAESVVVNQGIKRLFPRSRPERSDPAPHHVREPLTSSFPSGHASSAMAAATMLSARRPRAAPAYFSMAAVVATSRVHVRMHHASDVFAGAAIGLAFAGLAHRFWPGSPRR